MTAFVRRSKRKSSSQVMALWVADIHKRGKRAKLDPRVLRKIEAVVGACQTVGSAFKHRADPSYGCESCGGCGVIFDSGKQVEQCDVCRLFVDDEEALRFVKATVTGGEDL